MTALSKNTTQTIQVTTTPQPVHSHGCINSKENNTNESKGMTNVSWLKKNTVRTAAVKEEKEKSKRIYLANTNSDVPRIQYRA